MRNLLESGDCRQEIVFRRGPPGSPQDCFDDRRPQGHSIGVVGWWEGESPRETMPIALYLGNTDHLCRRACCGGGWASTLDVTLLCFGHGT
ncbi:hypothetical protein FRC03_000647 [Tulasnella sp. 419]|nr:hypothetical protein FRC03_000647 [Tulasnella sp. 419]